jgi:predicted HTH transcriptional regulator
MRSPINIEELLSGHRSLFLIDIPCHPNFVNKQVVLNKDFIKDFIIRNRTQLTERQEKILLLIAEDGTLTSQKISQKTGVTQRTVLKDLSKLQTMGIIAREGGRKNGLWVIVIQYTE